MTREIKFRGLSKEGQWFYGYYWAVISVNPLVDHHYIRDGADHRIKKETISQFTGLKDKNGKEIYEGDIVKYMLTNSDGIPTDKEIIGDVYYESHRFDVRNLGGINFDHLEVIGNIYENPELL